MTFPIIGWVQLPKELTRKDVFANIRRSGVNVFMSCSDSPAAIREQLDLAAEHGLQALVVDPRFAPSDKAGWEEQARAAVREYEGHPACFGFYVRDEPGREHFESVGRMVALLRIEQPEKMAYVNGFGFGGRGADSFFEYVEEYARIIKPAFLSFDAYPISTIPPNAGCSTFYQADRGVEWPELGAYYRDSYWEAWETYRLVGWKYDLPLWGFVLATPHQHSVWFYGPVTEGTLRLEAFTGLAHGIHALQYFTLPTVPINGWDDAILDPDGEPSIRFENFRKVNRDVARFGPIVKNLTCSRVFHTGPLTSNCCRWATVRGPRDSPHRPVARLDGDPVIISFLKGETGRYAMIVNRNPVRRGRVQVETQNGWTAVEISKRDGTTETPLKSVFSLDLEPGDGRLFRFLQAERMN